MKDNWSLSQCQKVRHCKIFRHISCFGKGDYAVFFARAASAPNLGFVKNPDKRMLDLQSKGRSRYVAYDSKHGMRFGYVPL